jgi:hypothetical protein
MKRLKYLAVAGVVSVMAMMGVTPSAYAGQPTINCDAHVFDATASQGIYKDGLQHQINEMTKVHPAATGNIYAQAYEYMPGGSVEGFWELAKLECANWFADGSERPKSELLVVAYGRDIDQVSVNYGSDFQVAVGPHNGVILMNGVNSSLGPQYSQVDPNYITSALSDALRSMRVFVESGHYFDKKAGIYKPPAYVDPMAGYEPPNWGEVAGMVALTIVGFVIFGLFCWGAQVFFRRVFGSSEQQTTKSD